MDCILELLLNIFPGLSYFFGRNNVRKGEIASVLGGESFYANEFSNALCLVFFTKFRSIQMVHGNELKFRIIFNIQSLYEEKKKKFHYIFVPVLFLSRTLIVLKIKNLRRKRKMEENLSKITTVRVKSKIFKIK